MVARAPIARSESPRRARISGQVETRGFALWLARGAWAALRSAFILTVAFATLALVSTGFFRRFGDDTRVQLPILGALAALLVYRLFERAQRSISGGVSKRGSGTEPGPAMPRSASGKSTIIADLELGTLFIAAAFAVIEITGGPSGLLYPLVFALVAFLVAFHGHALSVYFLAVILATEALIQWQVPEPDGWRLYASHTSFNLLFGLLYALFLHTEVTQRSRRMKEEIRAYIEGVETEAREFRLTSGQSASEASLSPEETARRRQVSSVNAIKDSLYNVLGVAERALAPHTVALLWLDTSDKYLRLKELRSKSDAIVEKPVAAGEGLLGAITKRREPLVLTNLKRGHTGLVYYRRPESVTDFAGVPVLEGPHLRGVLIVDRTDSRPFDESDVGVLNTVAAEIIRAVQVERIFNDMDRDTQQKERFYEASRDFNKTRTVREVAEKAIAAAHRVSQAEFAAVTVSLAREGRQRIEAVDWQQHPREAESFVGREFNAEEGLVGAAIKARYPMPVGTLRSSTQHVLSPSFNLPLAAVKVLPLIWQDQGVGALVLAGAKEHFLSLEVLEMLRVIADHAAIALANAQMNESIERMATTDGLTGLLNHRTFQEKFDEAMTRAERYNRKLSVILTDIDHFKSVNDTYGHPVGDMVLKRIAAVLGSSARRVDVVARYGGEEFAILMDETDRQGAKLIAERIRLAVAAETFRCEQGAFRASLSLGVATFPDDASNKAKLTECADQALYVAKREGRNRSVSYDMLKSRREVAENV